MAFGRVDRPTRTCIYMMFSPLPPPPPPPPAQGACRCSAMHACTTKLARHEVGTVRAILYDDPASTLHCSRAPSHPPVVRRSFGENILAICNFAARQVTAYHYHAHNQMISKCPEQRNRVFQFSYSSAGYDAGCVAIHHRQQAGPHQHGSRQPCGNEGSLSLVMLLLHCCPDRFVVVQNESNSLLSFFCLLR